MPFLDVGTTRRKAMPQMRILRIWEASRDWLRYDAETGKFFRTARRGKWQAGEFLGGTDTRGYANLCLCGKTVLAHRLAWVATYGEEPAGDIDHINGCRKDNRIINLRLATRSQNCANAKRKRSNTSGYKGVSFQNGRWKAQIYFNRKKRHIGMFSTPEEAHAAYVAWAKAIFEDFARAD